ncbi:polysaccharide deacetylase family protein [Flavobacterium kingsejongi]|uniref:Polysaccharide deacetylase n=1 Tax=Flavobacterium kingsejongi TaxID=1678728 RepID=A0A2S1LM01_9FLAO|nr:polysaccharide deacetylase family protein [Flavobacterium kingsejongi]AWG24698.1 polysaccharide deacetylase [Flavobacterium kingsejongi]
MLTHKSNTFFLGTVLLLLFILNFYTDVAWGYFLVVGLFWLVIAVMGSGLIRMNYHVKAYCENRKAAGKKVAITFDDGPTPMTPLILDILKKHQVDATFFCIGSQIEKYPEIFQRILDEGHIVGNHSYTHANTIGLFSVAEMVSEIQRTDVIIQKFSGRKVRYYRPPFGVTNPNLAKALQVTPHDVIGWNIRSFDTKIKTADKIMKRIERQLAPGSVILLHDTSLKTVAVLEQLLVFLWENEYEAVTVEQLLNLPAYEN